MFYYKRVQKDNGEFSDWLRCRFYDSKLAKMDAMETKDYFAPDVKVIEVGKLGKDNKIHTVLRRDSVSCQWENVMSNEAQDEECPKSYMAMARPSPGR